MHVQNCRQSRRAGPMWPEHSGSLSTNTAAAAHRLANISAECPVEGCMSPPRKHDATCEPKVNLGMTSHVTSDTKVAGKNLLCVEGTRSSSRKRLPCLRCPSCKPVNPLNRVPLNATVCCFAVELILWMYWNLEHP